MKIKLTVTRLVGDKQEEMREGAGRGKDGDSWQKTMGTKAGGMTRRAKKSRKSFAFSNFTLLRVVLSALCGCIQFLP